MQLQGWGAELSKHLAWVWHQSSPAQPNADESVDKKSVRIVPLSLAAKLAELLATASPSVQKHHEAISADLQKKLRTTGRISHLALVGQETLQIEGLGEMSALQVDLFLNVINNSPPHFPESPTR